MAWYLQAAVYSNHFDGSFMWRQENPVSYHVEKDGETKFWDGGQYEVVGEVTYFEESEDSHEQAEEDESVVITSAPSSPPNHSVDENGLYVEEDLSKSVSSDLSSAHQEEEAEEDHHGEEEHGLEDDLAQRLRGLNLNPIPHVPRVNAESPSLDTSSEKQCLLDRLSYYGLGERKMAGDGNCQFRALSDQLYQTPEHHMSVRMQVVSQLAEAPDSYSSYVPMDYHRYLENMARDGEWGDHVTLQAAADSFGVKICLITSFKESCFIEIIPAQLKWQRGLYLSFWAEIHYNSICPLEENKDKECPFSTD